MQRIDLLDAENFEWVTIFEDPLPVCHFIDFGKQIAHCFFLVLKTRTFALPTMAEQEYFVYDRLILSNRARISFEARTRTDVLLSVDLKGWFVKPNSPQSRPPPNCPRPFRIVLRRNQLIDSRTGDAFCERNVCIEKCDDGMSFGNLDQVELAIVKRDNSGQSSVDSFWNDKILVEEPSFGTFVYNVSSFGLKSNDANWPADVFRLVGQVNDRSNVVLKESLDDRRLPGQFEINETLLNNWQDTGDVSFPRNNQTLFGDNEKTSAVSVLNGQVIFVWSEMQDTLWSFANDRWQNQGNAGITKLLMNASEPQPQRRLATINDNIILVISAYQNPSHDGSVETLKIARPIDQRVIDIFKIDTNDNRWVKDKATHHVSNIDQLRVEQVDKNLVVSFSFLFFFFFF